MERVRIVEVGPRDGLQNEKQAISTATKISLIERLLTSGLREIEATAFVSPKWVPQMADHREVMTGIQTQRSAYPDACFSALTPNLQGAQAALESGAQELVIFSAASESFSRKNINCSIAESLGRFAPVADLVRQHNQTHPSQRVKLRGSISCTVGCPYEGEISPAQVMPVVEGLLALGCDEIDLADTIGVGTPKKVQAVFQAAASLLPMHRLAGHFHDTYGQALANVYASLEIGVRTFHASVSGLGGCPYAVGASGNVATEDVVYLLQGLGLETGISLAELAATGAWISGMIGRPSQSRAGTALSSQCMK